jgi:hypothetical protein
MPRKPTKIPKNFNKLIFSSGIKRWLRIAAKQYGGYFNVDCSYNCSDPEPSFYP